MITEFRLYEMNENIPKVGDYVICNSEYKDEFEFIKDKVGQIIKIITYNKFLITYNNIPNIMADGKINHNKYIIIKHILHYSKDKEELESILNTNKFNI